MADNKLQELIETLKKQGVESGEASSQAIIEKAQKEAEDILAKARGEADNIAKQAKAEAEKNMAQLQSSMEIAASQFVTNLKKVIEEQLLALPLKEGLEKALSSTEFLQDLMKTVVTEFTQSQVKKDILLALPPAQQEKLKDFVIETIKSQAHSEEEAHYSLSLKDGLINFGFRIGKKDGSVMLDFSSEAFLTLFLQFLTPRFRELFKDINLGEATAK